MICNDNDKQHLFYEPDNILHSLADEEYLEHRLVASQLQKEIDRLNEILSITQGIEFLLTVIIIIFLLTIISAI